MSEHPTAALMLSQQALGAAEFAAAMAELGPWEAQPRLGVAVSGGSDSLALAILAEAWARAHGAVLHAFVVDHRLRPDSAAEAEQVRRWLAARGIATTILRGAADEEGGGSLQERARRLRYRLLLEACVNHRIAHLLLGHHQDDQAETMLMRLVRGSGLRGLAAMAPTTLAPGSGGRVRLVRPLLGCPKARLRAFLEAEGQAWVQDPSNIDPRHERVRWRSLMPVLAAAGVDSARLAATAMRLGRERAALDRAVAHWLSENTSPSRYGHVRMRMEGFHDLPPAVAEGVLVRLLGAVGGGSYPPRRERLLRALEALTGSRGRLVRTLAGCVLTLEGGRLLVTREPGAVCERRPARPGLVIWDGRFELDLDGPPQRLKEITISCLGAKGLAELRDRQDEAKALMPKAPARQLLTLPALWQADRLLEAPHFPAITEGSALATVAWAPRLPLTG